MKDSPVMTMANMGIDDLDRDEKVGRMVNAGESLCEDGIRRRRLSTKTHSERETRIKTAVYVSGQHQEETSSMNRGRRRELSTAQAPSCSSILAGIVVIP